MRRRGVFLSDQDFHSKMLKQTRKFWKLLIWNKKKLSWANISKMNGYFGKNFGDLSEFLPARLTTKCSQSFRFFKWKNWLYWKHLYCTLEKNVVYYSALCFIIETKLTMKFPHLFVIFPSLSLKGYRVSKNIRHQPRFKSFS